MLYKELYNRGPRLYPDKTAIIDGKRKYTYREYGERQNRLANALLGLGLARGDNLGVLMKNCSEFLEAFGAGAKTGIVIAGINYRLNADNIRQVLEDMQCPALMVDYEFVNVIQSLRPALPFLKTIISVGCKAEGMHEYESLLDQYALDEPLIKVHEDDPAIIIYTSGTTGFAKGCVATRRIAWTRACSITINQQIMIDDIYINALPLFHVASSMTHGFIFRGAGNVIMRDWSDEEFCRLVENEKVTQLCLAAVMLNAALNVSEAKGYSMKSIRMIGYGTGPMPIEILERCMRMLPECGYLQTYGGSETFTLTTLTPEDHAMAIGGDERLRRRLRSCGRQAIFHVARVINRDGVDVKPGEIGEITAKGPNLMQGYLNKPEMTENTINDGWIRLGDLATVDEDGFIYVIDRKSNKIITGGENVYPALVEKELYAHPKVFEAVVLGVPDEKWGEAVKAIIVLNSGEQATEEEIIEFCRPRMPNYAKPKTVEFRTSIPHLPTGKLDRLAIKKEFSI